MSEQRAYVELSLEDIVTSLEEVKKTVDLDEHIFEVRIEEGEPLGYVSLYDLKAYSNENLGEASNLFIKNLTSNKWVYIFEHPYFQRRKPQLVPSDTLREEDGLEFYVLNNGQKDGPYGKHEIIHKLEEKELLLTDLVSYNGGHTWSKLFQVEGFDRRNLKDTETLPSLPDEVLAQPLENVIGLKPETEAMSNLAYLSNVKRGKSQSVEPTQEMTYTQGSSISKFYKITLALSLIGIGYFLYVISNELNSPFAKQESVIGEQAPLLTPIEEIPSSNNSQRPRSRVGENRQVDQINNQNRVEGKFETRSLNPVRSNVRRSFMDTKTFQESQQNNADSPTEEDANFYYDNSSAMELDPVRSQVSKENYDEIAHEAENNPIPVEDNVFDSNFSN